jgi:hypothetical protein
MFGLEVRMNEITYDELLVAVGEGIISPMEYLNLLKFWLEHPKWLVPQLEAGHGQAAA